MKAVILALAGLLLALPALRAQRPKNADDALARFAEVRDEDERRRHSAVYDLGRFPDDAVTDVLLRELARAQSISYRRNVVRAIGYKQRNGVCEPLRDALLAADNPRIADACANALERQGDDGVSTLAAALAACDERAQRNAICYALGRVERHDGARDALLAELKRAEKRDRLPPLRGLANRAGDDKVDAARVALAKDADPLVAATALLQLAEHGHDTAPELAIQLARRMPDDADADLHTAVMLGLLVAPSADGYAALFRSAMRADDPFGAARADAWRKAMTGELLDWIAAEAARAAPADRQAFARALAFSPDEHRERALPVARSLLADRDQDVARAAAGALCMLDRDAAAGALRELLQAGGDTAAVAVTALHELKPDAADWRAQLLALCEHKRADVRTAALRALAELAPFDGADDAAAKNLGHRDWSVRAAAVALLASNRSRTGPPLLFARCDKESGRLRQDVLAALRAWTGRSFATTSEWKKWWKQAADTFEPLPRSAEQPAADAGGDTAATYWNIPVHSERVAFVVDTSGSMAEPFGTGDGTRLDEAKRQLHNVFDRIPKKAKVNVIAFAADADALFDELQPLDKRRRKAADAWVDELPAKGPTDVHEALQRAFADEQVDTIFLLTDGRPSVGAIVDPQQLAREVARWNRARGIRIHTIAIGEKSDLLEQLAQQSGGEHTIAR